MSDILVIAAVMMLIGLTLWGIIKGKPAPANDDPLGWTSDDSTWNDNDWTDGDWGDSGGD